MSETENNDEKRSRPLPPTHSVNDNDRQEEELQQQEGQGQDSQQNENNVHIYRQPTVKGSSSATMDRFRSSGMSEPEPSRNSRSNSKKPLDVDSSDRQNPQGDSQGKQQSKSGTDDRGDNTSPFTKIPPPGAQTFADWFSNEASLFDDDDDDDNMDEDSPCVVDDSDLEMRESRIAVRNFMGPVDTAVARQFRRRRRKLYEQDDGYRHQKTVKYETVSYKDLDTPIWHNYTSSYIREHQETKKQKPDKNVSISTVASPQSQHRRPFVSFLSRYCVWPNVRSKTSAHPILVYQKEVKNLMRLVLVALGIIVSIVAFAVEEASTRLLEAKLDVVNRIVTNRTNAENVSGGHETNYHIPGFFSFLGFNLLFVLVACLPILYRPVAAGSGIAEAKAVLNGIVLPTSTDLVTALCKGISVTFAGAASLPVGLEGPLIFIGLALGENAQRFIGDSYAGLKTDRLKRDFATVGTSVGVTGAFLAPIGGVLFAMEEGASFWSPKLAWRSFASSCVAAIVMYFWDLLAAHESTTIKVHQMAIYSGLPGERETAPSPSFQFWDFISFAVMGLVGGVLGAIWIEANHALSVYRNRLALSKIGKGIEVLAITTLVSMVFWFLPQVYTVCGEIALTNSVDKSFFRQMNCPAGQYNHLGTLFMNPPGSVSLNLIFWEPLEVFSPETLMIAGTCYYCLLLPLFGTSISMGIFIPMLYVGACFGRAVGTLMGLSTAIVVTYSITSSVAMLGGVIRVLISITAIMICTTGLTYLTTPFMIATLFARVVGKAVFGRPGIYDVILEMKGIPFLEPTPPKSMIMRGIKAQDIMSRAPLVTLEPEQNVGDLVHILKRHSTFTDFPIVDPSRGGIFMGVVTREDLYTILTHRELFYTPNQPSHEVADRDATAPNQPLGVLEAPERSKNCQRHPLAVKFEELIHERYSKAPNLESVLDTVTPEDLGGGRVVDLTPYMEIGHYTLNRLVSVERAFELFRTLGLRDLVVTNANGRPVGVITRYDLKLLEEVGVDEIPLARKRKNVGLYSVS